ncbi:hypothetical protein K439DRAFT_1314891, partial [Ramaria rubella]
NRLTKSHNGAYLAEKLAECLKSYGIQDKILGMVADNASNNNMMLDALEFELEGFQGTITRVRCM